MTRRLRIRSAHTASRRRASIALVASLAWTVGCTDATLTGIDVSSRRQSTAAHTHDSPNERSALAAAVDDVIVRILPSLDTMGEAGDQRTIADALRALAVALDRTDTPLGAAAAQLDRALRPLEAAARTTGEAADLSAIRLVADRASARSQ